MKRILLFTISVLLACESGNIMAQCKAPVINNDILYTYANKFIWQVTWQGDSIPTEQWQLILIKTGSDPNDSLSWFVNIFQPNGGYGDGNYFGDYPLPLNTKFNCYVRTICGPGDTSAWSEPVPLMNLAVAPVSNVQAIVQPGTGIQITWEGTSYDNYVYRYNYQTGLEDTLGYANCMMSPCSYIDASVVSSPGWYYYKVVSSSGDSAFSNWVEYTLCGAAFYAEISDSVANIDNYSSNTNSYYWDFGDGSTSRTDSTLFTHTYTKAGVYDICLTASNDTTSCSSQLCQTVAIGKNTILLKPAFTPYVDSENKFLYTFYNNTGNDTVDYYWTFGDGNWSTDIQPTGYLYNNPGYYEVCLKATYRPTGQTATTCQKIQVGNSGCNMSADFSYVITDTAVQFLDRSLGNIQFYYWYFDDGSVSVDKDPVHKFSNSDHYVWLTISDTNWYCTDTKEQYIQVGTVDCKAAFDYAVGADNKTVTFSNTSSGNNLVYYWYFGDGSYSKEENPVQPFGQGKYLVTLVVEKADGSCMDYTEKEIQVGVINCSAQFSYIVDVPALTVYCKDRAIGENTKYYWYFGDGSFSNLPDPPHEFKYPGYYTIGLNTFDSVTWCMDYYEKTILVGPESSDCEADFFYKVNPDSLDVKFNDKSIGTINSYVWDFGDGIISTLKDPPHRYRYGSYYDVCLSVVNDSGVSNINCKWIEVAPSSKTNCYADFTYDIDSFSKSVTLVSKSLGDPVSYDWDLGDGNTSNQNDSLEYTYTSDNYYLISLHITTATGCESFGYKLINIGQPYGLYAKFGYNPKHYNAKAGGYPVDFGGAGLGDNSRLRWNFGDGSENSTNMSPTHVYTDPGKYWVCLTVADTVTHEESEDCDSVSTQTMCQNDSIDPVARCKNITISLSGDTYISPNDVDNGSSDDCGINMYSLDNNKFTPANEGGNLTHLTVTDYNSNVSTCSAIVTVVVTDISSTSVNKVNLTVSPNPLRNLMTVKFQLPVKCETELAVFDLLGKQVATISALKMSSGNQVLTYDASRLKSGSYILQLKTSTGIVNRQVFIKQ